MADGRIFVYFMVALAFNSYCNGVPSKERDDPPSWPEAYSVQGTLSLPYAEIEEPFSSWFDSTNKKSRIDYYGGMVITIQRADQGQFGTGYKVAPISTYTVRNQASCFKVGGMSEAPVGIQESLPSLSGFLKDSKQEVIKGQTCDVWTLVDKEGTKVNRYTMWVADGSSIPVRYEMMGFDSLLGSHYDKYVIDYFQYNTDPIQQSVFEPPSNMTCGDFPGPGNSVHRILNNPIKEFVNHHDDHIVDMFEQFKVRHQPSYTTDKSHGKEHAQRFHNFRQNVRYIHSKNRQGLSFNLAVNHLADKSTSELKIMNGYRHTPGDHGAKVFDKTTVDPNDVPDTIDWRLIGAVTQVKDQGVCGSCWSFGTVGAIEGAYFMKYGERVRFSQQQLVDCSWGEGNNGCDGGEDFRSYAYVMKEKGLTSEDIYGQYLAQDGYCHDDKVSKLVKVTSYTNVTAFDQEALTFALATKGPISVAIDASHKSLSFYSDGIYYEPDCGSQPDQLDHAVLAVGYGEINGQKYWLIKNSWSTYWGNDGYVLMSQKDNNCGVATAPTFVDVA